MKLVYPAIFAPAEEGGYTVIVPDLPGCITEGDDLAEAIEMGVDAAGGWILGEMEEGNRYPSPSKPNDIKLKGDEFVSMLVLDMDAYAERYGKRAVRRNITIPAWLDTYAQKNKISLSKITRDKLLELANG